MSIRDLIETFNRILPCPPNPMPEAGTDAWYRWQATLYNAGVDGPPHRIVEIAEYVPLSEPPKWPFGDVSNEVCRIIRVECDSRGRGVTVHR